VALSTSAGQWQGKVTVAEHLGSDTFLHVVTDHGTLTVRASGEFPVRHGDTVWLTPDAAHLHKFDAAGLSI
jgi:multiple sugar transport system ATP-binding protein